MQDMGILGQKEDIDKMLEAEEPITFTGGPRAYSICNACPEFFLHPNDHKPKGMEDLGVHEYRYDEEYRGEKFKHGASRHYTECAEYSLFTAKKGKLRSRKKISQAIRAELQKEINSACPFCSDNQVGHFHVHHIDQKPENDDYINLIMLCPTCHSKVTKGNISTEMVIEMKNALTTSNSLIECASVNIDSENCSWKRHEGAYAFYDERNGKSPFPLLQFSIINNSKRTVLFTDIELKAKYLPSGLSGIPMPLELESIATFKVPLPVEGKLTKIKLHNEIAVHTWQAFKFTTELYHFANGRAYPPDSRIILSFSFIFNEKIRVAIPNIFLNCANEQEKLTVTLLS